MSISDKGELTPEEQRALDNVVANSKASEVPPEKDNQLRPYTGAIRGGGVQEWIASQRLYVPSRLNTMQAVLYVLTKAYELTPTQADRVWNWLQPLPVPDTRQECEDQLAPLISKARST